MCLLIIAHQPDDTFPLVVASNRDEFHDRPTAQSAFWQDHPQLLAGRDLLQGGTWMGINRQGRFAALTNLRDPSRTAPAPRSRGELVLNFLTGNATPENYMAQLQPNAQDYAGFNLLLSDGSQMWYHSNSELPAQGSPRLLEPGIYGLSNALLDTPWPKVTRGKKALRQSLQQHPPEHDQLAAVVNDRALASPDALQKQGLNAEMDQLLSAQFIITERYGTRCTTTLWVDAGQRCHWRELGFDNKGIEQSRQELTFAIEQNA